MERHADVAVVRVDSLEAWKFAGPFVEEALGRARDCRGVILDLRRNGGGDMETLARFASFVLGPEVVPLATVTTNERVDEYRTIPMGSAKTGAVLVSERTYSSGEALAYVLQNRGVAVVGRRTAGAADHCVPVRVSAYVVALVPYGVVLDPLTGSNWEGTGVIPDIEVAEGDEMAAAMLACADGARPGA
ncbi:S41 family peptidase [Actinoplanes sp. NBC_00393]|uniref:S41 family peptidase n=1 Tax=Actinoplanes sp. NBC_00393 TaxID=2975953 RepID=UPI002E22837E